MIFGWGKKRYIGKSVLIGITFLNDDETVLELFQTHGKIVSVDPAQGIRVEKADGTGIFNLPPGTENLVSAARGEYRLKTTGEIVFDPDYIATWTLSAARPELVEGYKQKGFGTFKSD